jgi:hypothetical protein
VRECFKNLPKNLPEYACRPTSGLDRHCDDTWSLRLFSNRERPMDPLKQEITRQLGNCFRGIAGGPPADYDVQAPLRVDPGRER